ncbi:MAG: hypothetical protein ACXV3A_06720 [Kineosporiaceae bacterium]
MRLRSTGLLLALGLVLALVTGCSGSSATEDRKPGDPITRTEADVLAEVLHRNFEKGGADVVVSAPYGEGTVLTMTGQVDFVRSIGKVQAVTKYSGGRPDDTRTVVFSPQDIWFGDVPGLPAALTAAHLPPAQYVHRPIEVTRSDGTASLVDVLTQLLVRLSARSGDDPRSFIERHYTWQGQKLINGQLSTVFGFESGKSVAVADTSKLLAQYVTQLPDQDFDVTITLSDHGPRQIDIPTADQTVDAAQHPEIAAQLGV